MAAQRETVVLVHGLYVHGLWMRLLSTGWRNPGIRP